MKILNLIFSVLNQYCSITILILIKTFLTISFSKLILLPVENFIAIFKQLNKDNSSILHLDLRSLNGNIDNFREFLASLNENFSVIVLRKSWCKETANQNSLANLDNYNSVHQTRNNIKVVVFIHTSN